MLFLYFMQRTYKKPVPVTETLIVTKMVTYCEITGRIKSYNRQKNESAFKMTDLGHGQSGNKMCGSCRRRNKDLCA